MKKNVSETSKQAYKEIQPILSERHTIVLNALREICLLSGDATDQEIKQYMLDFNLGHHAAKTKLNNVRYAAAKTVLKANVASNIEFILLDIQCNGNLNALDHMQTLATLLRDLSKAV